MTDTIPKLPSGEPIYKYAKVEGIPTNGHPITSFETSGGSSGADEAYTLGEKVIEGKTKAVYAINSATKGKCLVVSKDIITAGDGAKKDVMEGKAVLSTTTNSCLMEILNKTGVKTSFIKKVNDKSYLAWRCDMIPIEWVIRRVATGSFLKRNPGVSEGYKFCPPKLETFFKDDENHDPQWSREALEEAKLKIGNHEFTSDLIDVVERMSIVIFEILERIWKKKDVSLIDMKLEFGIRQDNGEIVLSDVIDNDSWRIWPSGDKRLMRDKQVYRNMDKLSTEGLENLKKNYRWVADKCVELNKLFVQSQASKCRAVIFMGSASDMPHCNKIKQLATELGCDVQMHVSSAHKSTEAVLKLLARLECESLTRPTCIIAVAGRSNGLGPVLSGNTCMPVINCPPLSGTYAPHDVWSSLRLPSGLGCSTVLTADAAAYSAAQLLCQQDVAVWCRLRARQLNTWAGLRMQDSRIEN